MTDKPRLIEHAFPLKQTSLDSVHEKNVRHGHISTMHIWPARRPLAACRATLIATLLPDPGTPEKRKELCEKIGGRVVEKIEKKKMPNGKVVETVKEETVGGILHWGRETENKETLDWFKQEIRKAYGGRAPKVLDPFAGGGAIPLEAMRLGCEATAIDINPVAWFILKCTLEYPQKLAGQKRPLPEFILKDKDFMEDFFKSQGLKSALLKTQLSKLGLGEDSEVHLKGLEPEDPFLEADLAWHVRAWGKWVLNQARKDLAKYYPTYAGFEPVKPGGKKSKHQDMQLVPLKDDGTPDIDKLHKKFSEDYLKDETNPRWVAKPTVAYLWARTVKCKNCRATIPLLKTRWLCKKDKKRILLTMEPNRAKTGVTFGVEYNVPVKGGNTAQRREHDKSIAEGTMSRSGVRCPCCSAIMTMEDIRIEGQAKRLFVMLTAVVTVGTTGKAYRLPTDIEIGASLMSEDSLTTLYRKVPFGPPDAPIQEDAKRNTWCVQFGIDTFEKLFTKRQLYSLGVFLLHIQNIPPTSWTTEIRAYLTCVFSKLLDYENMSTSWYSQNEQISHLFKRFALPILWDFTEASPIGGASGSWESMLSSVCKAIDTAVALPREMTPPAVLNGSSTSLQLQDLDLVLTDPPYYDAIGYATVMDFFYVWLRREISDLGEEYARAFHDILSPKWNTETGDGELVDDASRHNNDRVASKKAYEDGMAKVFERCHASLKPTGLLVIAFANKQPDAWETLVGAIIRAGFVVDGSWPIQTEMSNRARAQASAALASSVWLVCKKRDPVTRPGWDNKVLEEMKQNIAVQLREFWDAGIRGPDFVWAATGPAMEAYSKYPVVKKANEPGKVMEVSEFLRHVRRMVVDFVVGRVLTHDGNQGEAIAGLDDVTTYYLLHRHDFGIDDAPAGPCILYAVSCGLTDGALADQFDILQRTGGQEQQADEENTPEDAENDAEESEGSGSSLKLKPWNKRNRQSMGYDPSVDSAKAKSDAAQGYLLPDVKPETPKRREIPLIDQIHRLMHLWKAGELVKVDDYLETRGLLKNKTFHQVLQSVIELAPAGSEERSILESISNHLKSHGITVEDAQRKLVLDADTKEIEE